MSPAYFISLFGDRFTPAKVASALPQLRELGYDAYQLEVFHPDTLTEWADGGASRVVDLGRQVGLVPSQFVGHFLLHAFESDESVKSDFGLSEIERVVEMLVPFDECRVVTVALPAFAASRGDFDYPGVFTRYVAKLERMVEVCGSAGFRVGLEILPGALIGGSDGFLRVSELIGSEWLGYNLDTGHAWAQKEPVHLLPEKLSGRIRGTHLCDNDGGENLSLCPGKGTIDWSRTVAGLERSGYGGSWDVEIKCDPGDVAADYGRALNYLKELREDTRGREE